MKRNHFSLIELLLALGVIVVGLVSILGLFPIGANAARDAMAENYAGQVAERILATTAHHVRKSNANWSAFIYDGTTAGHIPDDSAWTTPEGKIKELASKLAATDLSTYTIASAFALDSTDKSICVSSTSTNFADGLKIKATHKDSNGVEIPDFEAFGYIWTEPIDANVSKTKAVRLHIRITWPVQIPYARRQKADYNLEIFNPNL